MAGNQNSGKRGLANADQATRKRVASAGGSSHDSEFFSEIGKKGGQSSRKSRGRSR